MQKWTWIPLTEQQVGAGSGAGAGVTVAPYGSYNLRSGGAAVRFWPMVPGSTVAGATAPTPPPPAVAPRFALVDVLIRPTEDPKVVTAIAAPNLLAQVTGPPPAQTMPLVPDAAGVSQICFAVPVAAGTTHFDGTLRLEIRRGTAAPGAAINVDLPLRVPAGGLTANLAVFFIVHTGLNRRYAWTQLRAESNVAPNAPIAGANVELNLLRDNSDRTFSKINRQIPLVTTASGFAAFNGRDVIGISIGWPLIYKAAAAGFAPRGHILRLAAANISDNLTPFVAAPPLRMLPSTVSLAGRRIMLDAGHGAVYALARFRRSQEWYVAHRIVDRVAEVLRTRHSVNAADILLTRTAGFALIDPAHIAIGDAPERGNRRFAFDLANRQVRIADNALGLRDVSDLVLTQHHPVTGAPQPVVAADRTRLLTVNATTVTSIETRLNNQLAPGQRVRPGSIRWDPATTRYIYIREPAAGGAGTDRPLPITTTDMWTLDAAMINNLIDRSALWSLQSEIGTAAAAQQIAGRPFTATARAAMRGAGALDYIRTKIRSYLPPNAAHAWATGGIMGWNLARRVQFFNANNCDLYVSVHANAAGGKGGMALVSNAAAGASVPPQDQIRLGKIALKYLDPFNQGLRQGGIAREILGNATPLLQSGNTVRGRYLYLEIEFMDAAKFRTTPTSIGTSRWSRRRSSIAPQIKSSPRHWKSFSHVKPASTRSGFTTPLRSGSRSPAPHTLPHIDSLPRFSLLGVQSPSGVESANLIPHSGRYNAALV